MIWRSPAVRRRWRGISARAHTIDGAFSRALPDASSLPLAVPPVVVRAALLVPDPPDVHRATLPAWRSPSGVPAVLRGALGDTLVAMVRAETSEDAIVLGRTIATDAALVERHGAVLERALSVALGREALPGRWGDDAIVDRLRARQLDRLGTELGAAPRWLGVLSWLARQSDRWRAYVPADVDPASIQAHPLVLAAALDYLPIALASFARANGCRVTLALATASLDSVRLTKPARAAMRTLLLRCAIEGEFVPGSLRRLVPAPRARVDTSAAAWRALLVARRALVEHGHVMGAAQLTAALVATDVRRCVVRALREDGRRARVPRWGGPALDDAEAESLSASLHRPAIRLKRWHSWVPAPWPEGWGAPDSASIESALARLLDSDPWTTWEVFLHDGLAVAAVLALSGHAANALATLGACRTPPGLSDTRARLARAIHRGVRLPTVPPDGPWSQEAEAVYRQLRTLPDPSLACDAPYWLLGDQRAELQHTLQTSGRLREFRDLRLLLDRPDVAARLAPFWLLREDADAEQALIGLVHAVGRQIAPASRDECLHFLRSRL
jgi:hypothetical protein